MRRSLSSDESENITDAVKNYTDRYGNQRTMDTSRIGRTKLKVMEHRGEHWSNREIARRCAVSLDMVNRKVSERPVQIETPTTVTRNGTTYQMDTAKIGKRTATIDLDTGEMYSQMWTDTVRVPRAPVHGGG